MRCPARIVPLVLASLCLLFSTANAADEAAAAKPLNATAKLGYVQTGGNTDVVTLLASDKLEWKSGAWTYIQDAGAVYGENEGVENAGKYEFGLRAERALASRLSIYGQGSFRRNVYSGIEHQYNEGAGAVFHAIQPTPQVLDLEIGLGLLQRRTTDQVEDSFSTGRVAALYKYSFSEKATFEASTDWVVNLEDTGDSDLGGRASLSAPVAGGLSLNLGYNAQYRNRPLPGLENLDWTASAGLQFSY